MENQNDSNPRIAISKMSTSSSNKQTNRVGLQCPQPEELPAWSVSRFELAHWIQRSDKLETFEWNTRKYSFNAFVLHSDFKQVGFLDVLANKELSDVLLPEQEVEQNGCQTRTIIGDKTYLIGGSDGESNLCVRIFDNSSKQCTIPTVFGAKPKASLAHSALLLSKDRILITLEDSTPDDCIWFLEVDTGYVQGKKNVLNAEVVAWSKGVKGKSPMPVVISGPSGVGKGTLISKLMEEFPSTFGFSVSHTTRLPRVNEKNGVHYHFTERKVMENAIEEGHFLEFASVHGNLYGTSILAVEAVADAGKRCILDIDVQGAKSVRRSSLQCVFIFINPPSIEELERRLRARGTEVEDQVQKRLENARKELEQSRLPGLFDHILVNDDFEKCYESLKELLNLSGSTRINNDSSTKTSGESLNESATGTNKKFLVHLGKESDENLFMLELSSLNGGAPGLTRGFNLYQVENQSCENKHTSRGTKIQSGWEQLM